MIKYKINIKKCHIRFGRNNNYLSNILFNTNKLKTNMNERIKINYFFLGVNSVILKVTFLVEFGCWFDDFIAEGRVCCILTFGDC